MKWNILNNRFGKLTMNGVVFGISIVIFLCQSAGAQVIEVDTGGIGKREAVHRMAIELIEVGIEQCDKALFEAAEKSFKKAERFKKYLSDGEFSKLVRYLKRSSSGAAQRKGIVEHILQADKLVKEGELIRAKAHLKAVNGSEFLTDRERKLVKEGLNKVDEWLKGKEKQIERIYERSVQLYNEGQVEDARAGFIRVAESGLLALKEGETAEDYIHMIDNVVGETARPLAITDIELYEQKRMTEIGLPKGAAILGDGKEPARTGTMGGLGIIKTKQPEDAYFEAINQKRSLIQGYTIAIVKDSFLKTKDYISTGKYYQAQKEVERVRGVLEENRLYIEDDFYTQSSSQLRQFEDEINKGREKWLGGISR